MYTKLNHDKKKCLGRTTAYITNTNRKRNITKLTMGTLLKNNIYVKFLTQIIF
jgi:hypothetical protein